ncbi:MAG: hypothetical protein DMF67_13335, partial [Acidobacteria bacterium]
LDASSGALMSVLSLKQKMAHRRGAECAEEAQRKTMHNSLRPLCVLCASAVNRPVLYAQV